MGASILIYCMGASNPAFFCFWSIQDERLPISELFFVSSELSDANNFLLVVVFKFGDPASSCPPTPELPGSSPTPCKRSELPAPPGSKGLDTLPIESEGEA